MRSRFFAILFSIMAVLSACDQNGGGGFDSASWKADAGCPNGSSGRNPMTSDLGTNHLRVGMAEQNVIALLGEPEEKRGDTFIYCIGYVVIDYDSYHITFDAEKKVVSYRYSQG